MEIGFNRAVITRNSIETIDTKDGPKPAVVLGVTVDEEPGKITIWLTERALGIARKHLKTCGFDPDNEEFGVLVEKPGHLAGHEVDVVVEQRGAYYDISLPLGNPPPPKAEIARIGAALRKHPPAEKPTTGGEAPSCGPTSDLNLDDIPF